MPVRGGFNSTLLCCEVAANDRNDWRVFNGDILYIVCAWIYPGIVFYNKVLDCCSISLIFMIFTSPLRCYIVYVVGKDYWPTCESAYGQSATSHAQSACEILGNKIISLNKIFCCHFLNERRYPCVSVGVFFK